MPALQENTKPSAPTEEDARRLAFRAFFHEMRGTRLGYSIRIAIWALVLPALYTLVIAAAEPSLHDPWIGATQFLTRAIGDVALTPNSAAANLALRGFAGRAPLVSHALAMQWVLFGLQFLMAAMLMIRDRPRLRSAFAASRAEYRRVRPKGVGWVVRFLIGTFLVLVLIWWPLLAGSTESGNIGLDLATNDLGLLFPGLVMVWAWWCILYFVWLRLLALSGPRPGVPDPR